MIGKTCKIIGTDLEGVCVGSRYYVGDQNRYSVRFLANGVPQEREFTAGEVSFSGRNTSAQVIEFRRTA